MRLPKHPQATQSSAQSPCACGTSCGLSLPQAPGPLGPWLRAGLPVLVLAAPAYLVLDPLARLLTERGFGLSLASPLGGALDFFLAEAPKVLALLAGITFLVGFLQSYLRPERVHAILARRGGPLGHLLASLFGILTPFCSCSAVPLFIGFVRAGLPLGMTFSYLVAAPMINEVALGLLLAMFGLKVAALYTLTGLTVAFLSGLVLGRLGLEGQVEPWVLEAEGEAGAAQSSRLPLEGRLALALANTRSTVGRVWPYVLAGLGVGAFIHGYVPAGLLAGMLGKGSWWTVPLAVVIGVPLYASTAVILPIAHTLLAKGAALGTVLAFMMAVTALSLPEAIILRRVLKPRLIAVFLTVVTLGIAGVGYLFNAIL